MRQGIEKNLTCRCWTNIIYKAGDSLVVKSPCTMLELCKSAISSQFPRPPSWRRRPLGSSLCSTSTSSLPGRWQHRQHFSQPRQNDAPTWPVCCIHSPHCHCHCHRRRHRQHASRRRNLGRAQSRPPPPLSFLPRRGRPPPPPSFPGILGRCSPRYAPGKCTTR